MVGHSWLGMLEELLADDSDTVSDWEVDFIESLDKQRQHVGSVSSWKPTDRQAKKLEQIWRKVFG